MTGPVNNANFTTPVTRDSRQTEARPDTGETTEQAATGATRPDSLSLSSRAAEPAADTGIQSSDGARATLERLKQLLMDNPAGAVTAHGNIDPQSAAGALRVAA